jgi:hypothetical protein
MTINGLASGFRWKLRLGHRGDQASRVGYWQLLATLVEVTTQDHQRPGGNLRSIAVSAAILTVLGSVLRTRLAIHTITPPASTH